LLAVVCRFAGQRRPPGSTPFPYTPLFRSERVTAGREAAAEALAGRVSAELAALAMPDAQLVVEVEQTELGAHGRDRVASAASSRSEEHTSELQSRENLVCRLLLEKKKQLD